MDWSTVQPAQATALLAATICHTACGIEDIEKEAQVVREKRCNHVLSPLTEYCCVEALLPKYHQVSFASHSLREKLSMLHSLVLHHRFPYISTKGIHQNSPLRRKTRVLYDTAAAAEPFIDVPVTNPPLGR